jgi:outer membrane protein assembly factor BamA
VGYQWRELIRLTTIPLWYTGPLPGEGVLASGRAAYLFNSSRKYDFSISPEGGRTLELGYERFDKSLGSDYEFHKYIADWHEYVDLPWKHHVLSTRAFAGIATGADSMKLPQGVFQLGGDSLTQNPQDAVVSLENTEIYLRGYPVNVFRGRKAALASVEYRFPLVNVERGEGSLPFFLRRLHGAVFFEAGNAWNNTFHHTDLKRSVGVEARFDLYLAYYLPVTLRLGIAAGLDEEGETIPTIGLWLPLEL